MGSWQISPRACSLVRVQEGTVRAVETWDDSAEFDAMHAALLALGG